MLGRGARGEEVRDLQLCLAALGYPLDADGSFGPATVKMLRRFQRDHGLAEDGLAGSATMQAIKRHLPPAGPSARRMASFLRWLARVLALGRHLVRFGTRPAGRTMDKRRQPD